MLTNARVAGFAPAVAGFTVASGAVFFSQACLIGIDAGVGIADDASIDPT